MFLKEFFKPTIWKIVIAIILLLLISLLLEYIIGLGKLGFPLASLESDCPPPPYSWREYNEGRGIITIFNYTPACSYYFSIIKLAIDLIFWYLISCIIVFTYKKIKKKNQQQ